MVYTDIFFWFIYLVAKTYVENDSEKKSNSHVYNYFTILHTIIYY